MLDTLHQRLSTAEWEWLTEIGTSEQPPAAADNCVQELKRLGYERQRAAIQNEIDQCQTLGTPAALAEIDALWQKKRDLLTRLESLRS